MKNYCLLLLFLGFIWSCDSEEKEKGKPNILWIVSEDNSASTIGAYGNDLATTPNIDGLAEEGILYENAFSAAPVCAPARSTLITGMYANSLGTQHMRSNYPIPDFVRFFPKYLREAGYYTTNNSKEDYNVDRSIWDNNVSEAWNESSNEAHYKNRNEGQPFFHVKNIGTSHESSLHDSIPMEDLQHDPENIPIPPYHPATDAMKHDWAQYYDKVTEMDQQVGEILEELEERGLADSTIVFYYGDHGGVLGRSKRFIFESGLRIPLIVHIPEAFQDLASQDPGTETDRLVNFADFGPTVLSLAGINPPDYMQGRAFLGNHTQEPWDYSHSFRGRMDERIDMVRSVRNKQFRYVRNYMPHKIYGQYVEYLWRAPSMRSWERAYEQGETNEMQSRFFGPKPPEELYNVKEDPHNVNNLANDPEYQDILQSMRQENQRWLKEKRDVGFMPEPMMLSVAQDTPLYDHVRKDDYPFEEIMNAAETSTMRNPDHLSQIMDFMAHDHPVVRYWGVIGCVIMHEEAGQAKDQLNALLNDEAISVRIAASEALYKMGEKQPALNTLQASLDSDNLMARVKALNILSKMGEDVLPAMPRIREMVENHPDSRGYDIRVAKRMVERFGEGV